MREWGVFRFHCFSCRDVWLVVSTLVCFYKCLRLTTEWIKAKRSVWYNGTSHEGNYLRRPAGSWLLPGTRLNKRGLANELTANKRLHTSLHEDDPVMLLIQNKLYIHAT